MSEFSQMLVKPEVDTTDPIEPQIVAKAKLKDENFVKKMKATLSPGLFELVDRRKSGTIISTCIAHCDDSVGLLAQVLQSKFIAGHSAFYWALVGSPAVKDMVATPPLITEFLRVCKSLSEEIQDEIMGALYKLNNDALFKTLGPSLPHILGPTTVEPSFEYKAATTTGHDTNHSAHATFSFKIPQFFDRLLVDQEVILPFCLSKGSIWRLKAKVISTSTPNDASSRWEFELEEIKTQFPQTRARLRNCRVVAVSIRAYGGDKRELPLSQELFAKVADQPFHSQVSVAKIPVAIGDGDLASFHGNKYLGPGRVLSGTVSIIDTFRNIGGVVGRPRFVAI